jgi:hypothetical protein
MTTNPEAPAVAPAAPVPTPDAEGDDLKALAEQVAHMADAMLEVIPDHLRPLIPEGLSPARKVAWFLKARDTGVFALGPILAPVPTTDSGKPTVTPRTVDVSTLPPVARMAHGYGLPS